MKLGTPNTPLTDSAAGTAARPWWQFFAKVGDILTALTMSGTTANRPTSFLWAGRPYFDTDLGKPVWYSGTGWVDATGTAA